MAFEPGRLLRLTGWLIIALTGVSLAFGVEQSAQPLELPELVVRSIDRARLDARRRGTISVETAEVEPGLRRVDIPAGEALESDLGQDPTVTQTPGCAYRAPVTSAMARMTNDPLAFYNSGLVALEEGQLDQAAFYFDQAATREPGHSVAGDSRFWLAEIKRRQGKVGEALVHYRKVEGGYAAEAAYRYAWMADRDGRAEQARVAWKKITADPDSPHNAEAHYRVGLDLYRRGKAAEALVPLREALSRTEPKTDVAAAAGYVLGMAYRASGELGEAEKAFTTMLLNRPDHPAAQPAKVALAWVLLEKGQPDEADRRFAWALEERLRDELATLAWYGRAQVGVQLLEPARVGDALAGLEAHQIGPPWTAWAHADLGWTWFAAGDYEQALFGYRAALEGWTEGDRGMPRYMEAESLYRLGRYGEAADRFEGVESGSPMASAAYHRGGVAALLAADPVRAEALLMRVANDYPGYGQLDRVWAWIGEARLRRGDPEGAQRAFEYVPRGSDAFAQTLYARGWVAFQDKRWDEAAELFREFLNRFPLDPNRDEAALTLARAHFNRRAVKAAVRVLDELQAKSADPHMLDAARYHKGWMLLRADRVEEGQAELAALVEASPQGPFSQQAQLALGWSYFGQERYEEALVRFDGVIALGDDTPERAQAKRKRADSLYNLGRYEEALAAYEALGATPTGRYGVALCHQRLGGVDEMADVVDGYLKAYPDDPQAAELLLLLAQSLDEAGDDAGAAQAYRRAAALSDGVQGGQARLAAARKLIDAGELETAEGELTALALMKGAVGIEATYELAHLQAVSQRYEEAAKTLQEGARELEDQAAAVVMHRQGAEYARTGGRLELAEQMIRQAMDERGEAPELMAGLRTELGRTQLQRGQSEEAVATLTLAVEEGAGLDAMWHLGHALEKAGEPGGALETYLRIGYLHDLAEPLAARAMLRAGILLESDGRLEQARKVWQKVRDGGPEPWNKEAALRLRAEEKE